METEFAANLHILLVEPEESLNIGSVARAMSNFAVSNLHLVNPRGFDIERAKITACWGEPVLRGARMWESLDAALESMQQVVGFSTRSGKNLPEVVTVEQFRESGAVSGGVRTALLFGPEDNGLRREHLERCSAIVRIPTSAGNPSLNLAQSVVLALYEITRGSARLEQAVSAGELASAAGYLTLDRLLDDVMKKSEFLNAGTPSELPGLVRSIFRRTRLSERELQIMLGLFSRIGKKLPG